MSYKRLLLGLLVLMLSFNSIFTAKIVHADISNCSANLTPHVVLPGSVTDAQFSIQNTDSQAIRWIQISKPNGEFVVNSTNISGWSDNTNSDFTRLNGGSLDPGQTLNLSISTFAQNEEAIPADWNVQVSDDPDGNNAINCSGSLDMAIHGGLQYAFNISNVQPSSLTPTSVTITWDTDLASTSQVQYGTDTSYGKTTPMDNTPITNHSVNLTGLKANTAYHYYVLSTTEDNGSASSGDNTLLTPTQPNIPTPIIFNNITAGSSLATPIPIKDKPTEKVPPAISIKTTPTNPYKTAPTISGVANDNEALAGIFYSTDGGKNWLLVDSATGLGGKEATFSFTPQNLDDNNYQILARAVDTSGNIGTSSPITIVIDRLPPIVGGNVVAIGPQILQSNQDGHISTLAGLDQRITLSTVGGPTSITLSVSGTNKLKAKSFSLVKSQDTGLWSGVLSFEDAGSYTLTANSIDGAGNKTTRDLNTVTVLPKPSLKSEGKALSGTVTAYYLEPDSNNWTVWDGGSYEQANPQTTDKNGNFKLLLPAGKYYLKVTSRGYQDLTSNIFTFDKTTPISTTLNMRAKKSLLSSFSAQKISLNLSGNKTTQKSNSLISETPSFKLQNLSGNNVNSTNLLGKPTVLSVLSTWSPNTSDQLAALTKLQSNKDINIIPVGLQESVAKLQAYSAISGYQLNWLADPDSTLTDVFKVQSMPTHYFLDRKGVVKKVVTGVLSKDELLNNLTGL